jgi:hypothetical protein
MLKMDLTFSNDTWSEEFQMSASGLEIKSEGEQIATNPWQIRHSDS